jgi:hypothetical protein
MHPHLVLDLGKVPVVSATEVDQEPVVGKFQKGLDDVLGTGRGCQRTDAQAMFLCGWRAS